MWVDPAHPSGTRPSYARHSRHRAPNDLLVEAVSQSDRLGGAALDVGAGSLNSTRYLLARGFTVQAVDPDPYTAERAAGLDDPRLTVHSADIQDVPIQQQGFDLIVAIHVLHLLSKTDLDTVVHKLISGLAVGGTLCATFVGVGDTWASMPWRATSLRDHEMLALMADLSIIRYDELEYDRVNVLGQPKHWHTLRCLARRTTTRRQPR